MQRRKDGEGDGGGGGGDGGDGGGDDGDGGGGGIGSGGSGIEEASEKPWQSEADDIGADADNDGFSDAQETAAGTDPNDPTTRPGPAVEIRTKSYMYRYDKYQGQPGSFSGSAWQDGGASLGSFSGQTNQAETVLSAFEGGAFSAAPTAYLLRSGETIDVARSKSSYSVPSGRTYDGGNGNAIELKMAGPTGPVGDVPQSLHRSYLVLLYERLPDEDGNLSSETPWKLVPGKTGFVDMNRNEEGQCTITASGTLPEHVVAIGGNQTSVSFTPQAPSGDKSEMAVVLMPVILESGDRFLTGEFNTAVEPFHSAQIEVCNTTSGENLGRYHLDGTGDTHIYQSQDESFSEQELDSVVAETVGSGSSKLNQKVVFWRSGSKVRFATTFEAIGNVELHILHGDGTEIAKCTHLLEEEINFSGLIDHLALRIDSIAGPPIDSFEMPPEVDGTSDDDDDEPSPDPPTSEECSDSPPPSAPPQPSWSATTRNLLSKVLIPVRMVVAGAKMQFEYNYKIQGGAIKGFVDGLCDGVKSDVDGIAELALMAGESVVGDFHRAKAIYDGIQNLAAMTSAERGQLFDSILIKIVNTATDSVPWHITTPNGADDWGISAYMTGYAFGFLTEQIAAIMLTAGIVTKAGEAVKIALAGTKLGMITADMVQAVRKFVTAVFMSVSIHVSEYHETAIRAVRLALSEVAQKVRAGKKAGEWVSEFMERVTPSRLKYQDLADRLHQFCISQKDWLEVGTVFYWQLSGLAQSLGSKLTEHGALGLMNLWKGALRHPVSGHYMHHLYNVCTVGGTLDAEGLARILEMFDDTSQAAFKFTPDAADLAKWTSPAGVVYEAGGNEGHRIMRILTHTVPGYKSGTHSVFSVARHQLFELIDEAWSKPHLVAYKADGTTVDASAFVVQMGREIGTEHQQMIRIVFKGNKAEKKIIAAYPVSSQVP